MMWLLLAGGVAVLSWWITRLLVSKASLLLSIDHPNDRSLHSKPTPRSGGLAILATVLIGLGLRHLVLRSCHLRRGFYRKVSRQLVFGLSVQLLLSPPSLSLTTEKGFPSVFDLRCRRSLPVL